MVELQKAADEATEVCVQARIDACVEAALARVMNVESANAAARAKAHAVMCQQRAEDAHEIAKYYRMLADQEEWREYDVKWNRDRVRQQHLENTCVI